MNRPRTTTLALLLLVALVSGLAPAQREGHRRWDPRDQEARRGYLEQLDRNLEAIGEKLDPEDRGEFAAIARGVVRRLDREAIERLEKLPLAEQVREIVSLHRREREESARRFIARQSPELRAELEGLDPKQRDARIFAIRAAGSLERSIAMASGHELVTEEDIQRLRALAPEQQLDEAFRLQRRIFMHVHGSEISAEEKSRLEEIDGRAFWRDPTVRRFQLRGRISPEDVSRLRAVDENERRALLDALRAGAALDSFVARKVLDQETAQRWSGLDERERGRLVRVLDRLYLSNREREYLPFDLVWRLPEETRREFFRQPQEKRREFLETNLAEKDRVVLRLRYEAMARLKPVLDGLEAGERGLLFNVMPEVARERLLSFLPDANDRVDALVADLEAAGFFLFAVPLGGDLRDQLSAEELEALAAMTTVQKADFVFQRFADRYDREARRCFERSGLEAPADWATWSGSRKLAHLNRLGQRLGGERFGGWRGRGHDEADGKERGDRRGERRRSGRRGGSAGDR